MYRTIRPLAVVVCLALFLTGCSGSGIRVPQSPLLAAVERKSGLIAYLGSDYNIYVVDQSGGNPAQVTEDARGGTSYFIYSMPVWSPDSESLVFAAHTGEGQGAPTGSSLFVAGRDGTGLSQVYSGTGYLSYYYWSPDSRHVSFIANTVGQNLALKLVPKEGGEAAVLDAGAPYYWTWAPDSLSMFVHAGGPKSQDPAARLSRLHLGDSVEEQVLGLAPAMFKAPALSPDGSRLLVAQEAGEGKTELLITDPLGNPLKTVAEYSGQIAFAWSPDGKKVAYITSESVTLGVLGRLTVVDAAGGDKVIELPDEDVYAFFWSPDSKSLAYFTPKRVTAPTPEPGGTQGDDLVVWDLSVMEAGSGKTHLVGTLLPTDEFLQVLPYFDQYHQSATIWSPDSKNLVVATYIGDDRAGIFVVAASGTLQPRFIAEGVMGFWSRK